MRESRKFLLEMGDELSLSSTPSEGRKHTPATGHRSFFMAWAGILSTLITIPDVLFQNLYLPFLARLGYASLLSLT